MIVISNNTIISNTLIQDFLFELSITLTFHPKRQNINIIIIILHILLLLLLFNYYITIYFIRDRGEYMTPDIDIYWCC